MFGWFRYTAWLHATLPVLLWWLARQDPAPGFFRLAMIWMHGLGLCALVFSHRWWRGRADELVLLLVANHMVTLVTGAGWLLLVAALGV